MIESYLNNLDAFISAADVIIDIEIIRRDIWDTGLEKIALYRYRLKLSDGSLIELTERILEERRKLTISKYRYHWQTKDGRLIMRWDNAPHHPEIETFPDHLHDGSESNVVSQKRISGLKALTHVVKKISDLDPK